MKQQQLAVVLLSALVLLAAPVLAAPGGRPPATHGRTVLQAPPAAAVSRELPRLVIGRVRTSVINTYSWSISREASAGGVAVTADGYSRRQLGHALSFRRSLASSRFRLEGVASITNPSGSSPLLLTSVTLLLGSKEVPMSCKGMPATQFALGAASVVECAFSQTWDAAPGIDTLSGYVTTPNGRSVAEAPAAITWRDCGANGAPAAPADGSMWAPCSVVERAACVTVTDGSTIVNKYKDALGQSLAGPVSRSRLFETSNIQDSTLGPARVEPATPPAAPSGGGAASVARLGDTPPQWRAPMPDSSWWTGNRRALLRHADGSGSVAPPRRQLRQQPQQQLNELTAAVDANFRWPMPQVAGNRPPLGLGGRAQRGADKTICESTTFSYSMIFGPLLPSACGTFEVDSVAGALPTDGSADATTASTFTYLQVLCPAKAQDTASSPAASAPTGGHH